MRTTEPDLPAELIPWLAEHLGGEIIKTVDCGSGFTPGITTRITVARPDGLLAHRFLKAIRRDHPLSDAYQAEATIGRTLPATEVVPTLRWAGKIHDWSVLIFDDAGSRTANFQPGSPDLTSAVATVNSLHRLDTPAALPNIRGTLGPILHGWTDLAQNPKFTPDDWTAEHLDLLISAERTWTDQADGQALLHTDIRAANLVVDDTRRVRVVDWAHACRGAPWIDTAELLSHLVVAGHTPDQAENLLAGTVLDEAEPMVVTSFIVASAGYWRRSSLQPPPANTEGLREFQARAADAATSILHYRLVR